MKFEKAKKLCSLILTAVLVGSCFLQYAGVVNAGGGEPSYSAKTGNLLYSEDKVEMGQGNHGFGVTVPADETYYMSFTVKTTGEVYFNYRGVGTSGGADTARFYLGQTQCGLIHLATDKWPQGNVGLKDGVKVTFKSAPDQSSFWIGGKEIVTDAALSDQATGLQGIPTISWASTTTTITDITIWTEKPGDAEPSYSEETGNLLYHEESLEMGQGNKAFDITAPVPADETYYVSFTAKTAGDVYFDYRGSNVRLYLGQTQYALLGLNTTEYPSGQLWPQGDIGLSTGAKITLQSNPDKTTIWVNGVKTYEDIPIAEAAIGTPKISWASTNTAMTGITVWTEKSGEEPPVSNDPKYDAEKDTLYEITDVGPNTVYENGKLTISDSKSAGIVTELPADADYYMTMKVKVGTDTQRTPFVNIGSREGQYIQLQKGGYQPVGIGDEKWVNSTVFSKLQSEGVKITIHSSSESFTLWADGEKIIDTTYKTSGKAAKPDITWNQGGVILSDIQIWIAKDGGEEEPPVSDEPQYEEENHKLYGITGVGGSSTYESGVITTANGAATGITTDLAGDAEYYMTMKVKLGTDTTGAPFVNLGSRGGAYFHIQKGGYQPVKIGDGKWVTSTAFSNIQTDGVKITIHSTPENFTLWAGGVKIVDAAYVTANEAAKPDITWNQGGVTLSDIQIWTAKEAGGEAPIGADEPQYNAETDKKYEVLNVTSGTYEDGILTVPKESSSMLLSDVPYNAAYYVTMKVKTAGAVSIGYRDDKNGFIQLQSNGYNEAVGSGREWHDKAFPTLATGARVTFYSSPEAVKVWVDGEKIVDRAYDNGGSAAPALTWTFSNPVEVSDICIWMKETAVSDEPKYDAKEHELHEIAGVTGGTWENGVLSVDSESSAYFKTDLDADADYYMSYIVQTTNYVNISYRAPSGQLNIQSSGYQSIGTSEGWVNKRLPKLSSGLPVAVHSTPNHITIWLNGEKIIDEAYTIAGESKPGISWSFNDVVKVSDVKIWTEAGADTEYMGEIEETAKNKLSQDKEYGAALKPSKDTGKYVDTQPIGTNVTKEKAAVKDGQSEVVSSDVEVAKEKRNLVKAAVPIAGVVILLGIAVIQFVNAKRKKER